MHDAEHDGGSAPLRTVATRSVDPDLLPALWELYRGSFEELLRTSLLDQRMRHEEFARLVKSDHVYKIIGWRGDRIVGLATLTNDLGLVPLLSTAALAERYPDEVARDALFYAVFVCVAPSERRGSLFAKLVGTMMRITGARGGTGIFDVSMASEKHGVASQIHRIASWFPDASVDLVDRQVYYEVVLPIATVSPRGLARLDDVVVDVGPDADERRVDATWTEVRGLVSADPDEDADVDAVEEVSGAGARPPAPPSPGSTGAR